MLEKNFRMVDVVFGSGDIGTIIVPYLKILREHVNLWDNNRIAMYKDEM